MLHLRVVFQLLLLFETTQLLRWVRTKSQHLMSSWSNKSRLPQHLHWLSTFSTKPQLQPVEPAENFSAAAHLPLRVTQMKRRCYTLDKSTVYHSDQQPLTLTHVNNFHSLTCTMGGSWSVWREPTQTSGENMQTSHRKAPGWGIEPATLWSSFLDDCFLLTSALFPPLTSGMCSLTEQGGWTQFLTRFHLHKLNEKTDQITKWETFGPHVVLSHTALSSIPPPP